MKRNQTRRLTLAAMMGAVSFVLMYFSFSVPVLSPFASFDLSALPDLIGGFVLGPVGAVEIIAVKVLLKLVFKGTSSMFTGEIQKFLLCTAYTLPAVLYYRKHRTKKGAAVGLVIGSICGVIGYLGFFVGGDFGAFVEGALPGILLGFSLLVLLVIPRSYKE